MTQRIVAECACDVDIPGEFRVGGFALNRKIQIERLQGLKQEYAPGSRFICKLKQWSGNDDAR